VLFVGVCRGGFRFLASDLYIYMQLVGVDVCLLCVCGLHVVWVDFVKRLYVFCVVVSVHVWGGFVYSCVFYVGCMCGFCVWTSCCMGGFVLEFIFVVFRGIFWL
jgi:hypothetical protein